VEPLENEWEVLSNGRGGPRTCDKNQSVALRIESAFPWPSPFCSISMGDTLSDELVGSRGKTGISAPFQGERMLDLDKDTSLPGCPHQDVVDGLLGFTAQEFERHIGGKSPRGRRRLLRQNPYRNPGRNAVLVFDTSMCGYSTPAVWCTHT
jgi:hypothetical protein